jgi:MFS family permease
MEIETFTGELSASKRKPRVVEFQKLSVVFGSFLVYFISDGVSLSFGIIIRELIRHFQKSVYETSLTVSLLQSIPLFASPIVCLLIEKYGCRPIAIIGSFLLTLSFVLIKFFATSLLAVYIIFGLIASLGLAMTYIPAYLIISYYFDKRRALATGFAVSGSGLGLFAIPPILESLIREYGWLDACFIFGAISSHLFISACLFRPLKAHTAKQIDNDKPEPKVGHENKIKDIFRTIRTLYSNKQFLVLNISYAILSAFITSPHNFLPDHIYLNSINDVNSWSISIIGISQLVGQILVGMLSDIYRSSSWLIYSISLSTAGIVTCALPFCKTLYSLYSYSILFGLSISVNYTLQSVLVIESTSLGNLTMAFGSLQLMQGVATLLGIPMVAWLKDLTGSYDTTFYVSGVFLFICGFIMFFWPFLGKKKKIMTRL